MSSSCRNDVADLFRPMVAELHPAPNPVDLFLALSHLPHCLFLDSALKAPMLGRYSFIAADPFDYWQAPADGTDALSSLENRMPPRTERVNDLPPFQGGCAGLFSYDLNRGLERLPETRCDEFAVPGLALGLYDVVISFDHLQNRAWIVSQGLPESTPDARQARAKARLAEFESLAYARPVSTGKRDQKYFEPLNRNQLAEQFPTPYDPNLTSNFSSDGYRQAVGKSLNYIYAGDIFQVNVAQRLIYPALDNSVSLYLRLRQCNPATFAGYFDLGPYQIISASPERFLSVRDHWIETRPIKGTRPRCLLPEADLFAGDELRESIKDRAENIMIVDLLRNDISRVCCPESVIVAELCRLEVYQYVQHLVSVVRGKLADGKSQIDLIRAAFPGGSITGAPKIRAMEIINELEPTARGAYCGSLGYLGFDGTLDLSILIRTITAGRGWWQMPVGSGIVAQSVPDSEYEETWHKAHGLLKALR